MAYAIVEGFVRNRTGRPLVGVSFVLVPQPDPGDGRDRILDLTGITQADGHYLAAGPPGTYQLQLAVKPPAPPIAVHLIADHPQTLDVVVDTTRQIAGLGQVDLCDEHGPPGPMLGRSLPSLTLGMSASDVRSTLGAPREQDHLSAIGGVHWFYPGRTVITFSTSDMATDRLIVKAIETTNPAVGMTVEGLRLGATERDVGRIYQGFPVCVPQISLATLQVSDPTGVVLHVHFDQDGQVRLLYLAWRDAAV